MKIDIEELNYQYIPALYGEVKEHRESLVDFIGLGYLGLFLASFLAATFVPFSSEAVVSYFIYQKQNILLIVAIATMGNFLGGMLSYYIGRLGKMRWCERYLGVKREKVLHLQTRIIRYGSILAFFSFLPVIGDPLAVALGFFRVSAIKVACFMLAGKAIRYGIWAWGTSFAF